MVWGCRVLEDVGLLQPSQLSLLEEEAIEVEIKYSGFVKRQQTELLQAASQHRKRIPDDLDYNSIQTLSSEAREKLCKVRPKFKASPIWHPRDIGILQNNTIAHSNWPGSTYQMHKDVIHYANNVTVFQISTEACPPVSMYG